MEAVQVQLSCLKSCEAPGSRLYSRGVIHRDHNARPFRWSLVLGNAAALLPLQSPEQVRDGHVFWEVPGSLQKDPDLGTVACETAQSLLIQFSISRAFMPEKDGGSGERDNLEESGLAKAQS